MLGQLRQLDLGHVHQGIDFVLGSFEILDAKGKDGDHFDS